MKAALIVILVAVVALAGVFVSGINRIVRMDEEVRSAWAQVEVQLMRRSDLIPNLVNTVKGYAAHEKDVFTAVADARSKLAGTSDIPAKIEASNALSSALGRLLAISERYPDLKANQNFINLQDELAGTENRIAVERKRYNDQVKLFNQHVRAFPGMIFAAFKGIGQAKYFDVDEKASATPAVDFAPATK